MWLGKHEQLGVERALKLSVLKTDHERSRFEREAQALARVDQHAGVVRVYGQGIEGQTGYIVLEFVEGSTLASVLDGEVLTVSAAVALVRGIAEALSFLHERGIVHRDIKPANILLTRKGQPVLTDFGVARVEDFSRLTATGALVGTPHYMAPEWLDPNVQVGPPADVYGLGVVFYEMLTGSLPFDGDTLASLLSAIASGAPPPPSHLRPGLDRYVDDVVLRCVAGSPSERPTAGALAEALRALERGEKADLTWGASRSVRVRRWARRLDRRVQAAVVLCLFLLAGAAAVFALQRRAAAILDEQAEWEARVLEPWAWGVGDGVLDTSSDELASRFGRLERLKTFMDDEAQAQARSALGRVRAAARLLDHQSGEHVTVGIASAKGAPEALWVDAIVLSTRGEHSRALRLLDRSRTQSSTLDRLRLSIQARRDPGEFLEALQGVEAGSTLQAYGLKLAPEILGPAFEQLLLETSRPDGDPAAVERLGTLWAAADSLGIDMSEVAPRKQALVDRQAEAWVACLRSEFGTASTAGLERLVGVLNGAPASGAGPKLELGLRALLDEFAAKYRSLASSRGSASLRALRHLLHVDVTLCYELGLRWQPSPSDCDALGTSVGIELEQDPSFQRPFFLAALRWGLQTQASAVLHRVALTEVVELSSQYPNSRAVRFGRALAVLEAGSRRDPKLTEEVLRQLEQLLTRGDDDLAPRFVGEAQLLAAEFLFPPGFHGPTPVRSRDPEKARRIVAYAVSARAFVQDQPKRFRESFTYVAGAHELAGLETEAIAAWDEAVRALKTRVSAPEQDGDIERHQLSVTYLHQAQALERFGRYAAAEQAFRSSAAEQQDTAVGSQYVRLEQLAKFLARRSRKKEALATCLEGFPSGYTDASLTRLAAKLLSQAGDPARLRAFFDAGLTSFPNEEHLLKQRKRYLPGAASR